jgi:segregation and condensation protein B
VGPTELRAAVEALLFASDSPLTLSLLAETLDDDPLAVQQALFALREQYDQADHGIQVAEIAGGWQILTRERHAPWIQKMLIGKRRARLSRAALETLAIIVYKQPVTRPEVESIRGVDSGSALATLLERDLITIRGRSEVVGRPLLYGTTSEFLSYFGLRNLAELPRPEELKAILHDREADADAGGIADAPLLRMESVAETAAPSAALAAAEEPADERAGTSQ